MAGVAGFEPTNAGIKIRCLNHLATPHYLIEWGGRRESNSRPPGPQSGALTNWATPAIYMVRLKRFELLTHGLEGRCSIHLSYRRIPNYVKRRFSSALQSGAGDGNWTHATSLEGWDSTTELHPHVNHAQRLYILSKIDRDVKRFYVDFIKFFIVFCP